MFLNLSFFMSENQRTDSKKIRFLVNFYGFTEAIAQSDGFGATPSIIPYKINEEPKIIDKKLKYIKFRG
jgi:hypothetical protein